MEEARHRLIAWNAKYEVHDQIFPMGGWFLSSLSIQIGSRRLQLCGACRHN